MGAAVLGGVLHGEEEGEASLLLGHPEKPPPLEAQPLGELPVQGEAVGPHPPFGGEACAIGLAEVGGGEARGGEAQGVQARSHVLGAGGGEEEGQGKGEKGEDEGHNGAQEEPCEDEPHKEEEPA